MVQSLLNRWDTPLSTIYIPIITAQCVNSFFLFSFWTGIHKYSYNIMIWNIISDQTFLHFWSSRFSCCVSGTAADLHGFGVTQGTLGHVHEVDDWPVASGESNLPNIRYTVMFLISTQPTDTFTGLQIRFATLIFHSQKPVSIIQHFTIGYSEACETFRWVRPALRSDTLKIKAIDLCSGRDSLPAWHAVLAALRLVCQWGSVCVCACMDESI